MALQAGRWELDRLCGRRNRIEGFVEFCRATMIVLGLASDILNW